MSLLSFLRSWIRRSAAGLKGPQQRRRARLLVEELEQREVLSSTLATIGLTPGWATFGEALPQGAAQNGLQVGNLPTQTDVKDRWSDGSIRFAVVSTDVLTA